MKLARVDQAIEVCREHLKASEAEGTVIEAYLTRYLLILITASFEEEIRKIIVNRASKVDDGHLETFVGSCVGAVFRSVKTSEIAGLLNRFGGDYKKKFQDRVSGTTEETYFNNIVTIRHETAHSFGANVTFGELVKFYEKGHIVLDIFSEVIQ